MNTIELLKALSVAENLKNVTRHSYTSSGKQESVAEHSWRVLLMAYFIKDEFPDADINKIILMCLIHDLGESFTGDIPAFIKTNADENKEKDLLLSWVNSLPFPFNEELNLLFQEMYEQKTLESKIFRALDGLEGVLQHNEADINTWSENEFTVNLTYADDRVVFSEYLQSLRQLIRENSIKKIEDLKK